MLLPSSSFSTALSSILPRRSLRKIRAHTKDRSSRETIGIASKNLGVSEFTLSKAVASELKLPFYPILPPLSLQHLFGFNFFELKRLDLYPVANKGKIVALAGIDPFNVARFKSKSPQLPFIMTTISALDNAWHQLSTTAEANQKIEEDLVEPLLVLLTTSESMSSEKIEVEYSLGEWKYSFFSSDGCVGVGTLLKTFGEKFKLFVIAHAIKNSAFTHFGYSVEVEWLRPELFILSLRPRTITGFEIKVLLVDEDTSFLTTTSRYLQKNGVTVFSGASAQDAATILANNSDIMIIIFDDDQLNISKLSKSTFSVKNVSVVVWTSLPSNDSAFSFARTRILAKQSDPRLLISALLFLSKFRQ